MMHSLDALYDYIYELSGLTFPSSNRATLDQKVDRFFKAKSIANADVLDYIQSDKQSEQELLDLLTVNESYFFREMTVVDEMVKRIMSQKGKVRILCAPSSSGEESFSIVISLLKAGKPSSEIEVVGFDINSDVIKLAKQAQYSKRRVHRVSDEDLAKYFSPEGDHYHLSSEVTQCVTFYCKNLFDDSIKDLGLFDIVFSRNMLIYFDKKSSLRAEKVFYNALKHQGYLLVGHADFIANEIGFEKEIVNGNAFYTKQ